MLHPRAPTPGTPSHHPAAPTLCARPTSPVRLPPPPRDRVLPRLGPGRRRLCRHAACRGRRDLCDRRLTNLIGELSTRSEEFRHRWAAHNVRMHTTGVKLLHHPVVGDLDLPVESFPVDGDPSQAQGLRTPHRQPAPPAVLQPPLTPRLLPLRPDQHHPRRPQPHLLAQETSRGPPTDPRRHHPRPPTRRRPVGPPPRQPFLHHHPTSGQSGGLTQPIQDSPGLARPYPVASWVL